MCNLIELKIFFDFKGTRILIHVADYPCHGQRYHSGEISDNHPERSDDIPRLLQTVCIGMKCSYWFIKCSEQTDKMIEEFNNILKFDNHNDSINLKQIETIDFSNLKIDLTEKVKYLLNETVQKETLVVLQEILQEN